MYGQSQMLVPISDSGSAQPLEFEKELQDDPQDVESIITNDLFPEQEQDIHQCKEHKLGLDINFPWGWSGFEYSDYE